ncbi:MAG: hypothetical protein ABR599_07120 [Gemmatimonadota bacterium]
MRGYGGGLAALAAVLAAACGDDAVPLEARYPIVEGIYSVQTQTLASTCRLPTSDGPRIYVFFQDGSVVQFRPPSFQGGGRVELLDLGIQGELETDGDFLLQGTYTIAGADSTSPGLIVDFSMEGRFEGDHLAGSERHLASFPGGSCEVTFAFVGQEI